MSLEYDASAQVRALIEQYSISTEGKKKTVITHRGFRHLPKQTKQLIEKVMKTVYRGDLDIIRQAFAEKLELYLRLIYDELVKAQCTDDALLHRMRDVRGKISDLVEKTDCNEHQMQWLKK